jgi:hypothetical protein
VSEAGRRCRARSPTTYSHFFPGRFIEETGSSKDIDFVELTVQVLF